MARVPSHRRRPDGRSVVTLNGRDFYHNEPPGHPDADQWYARLIAEYLVAGRRVLPRRQAITVAELVDAYLASAEGSERRDKRSLTLLTSLYGRSRVDTFGPLALRAVRDQMVRAGWNRAEVNRCADRVKRCFRWGVGQELVSVDVTVALSAVEGLRRGRTTAPEPKKIRPVAEEVFRATLPFLSATLRAVAELQWHTGARSGELLQMRPMDVDRSGSVWVYRPQTHKTMAYHERTIWIGPQAQAVLTPWLERNPRELCFRPAEVAGVGKEQYTSVVYARAVGLACKRAKVAHWHPHQLRHAAATRIRATHGIEVAQTVLGHTTTNMTEVYAERATGPAVEAMRKVG